MCGIVGYKGEENASEIVHRALQKLEYRGYDSAGIATVGNPSLKIEKGVGTIEEVFEEENKLDGETGIGHTRWATHGGVTEDNAHPHTSCDEEIAVVHNGIIENYTDLKEELSNHDFRSETDTEVLPHLLEDIIEEFDLVEAFHELADRIEGHYAVATTFQDGRMAGMRKGSPLVLGIGEDETFLASDVTSFLQHTEDVVFLQEDDIVIIDESGEFEIYNSGEKVEREVQKVDWDAQEASKEGFDHYMKKEITEQPETVKRAVFQDQSDMEEAVEMMDEAEKIYITGCGTAGIIASLGAKYLREAGYNAESELAHELEYRADEIAEDDLVIAVSQSGETADLLSMLNEADAETLAVVNVVGSTLARNSAHQLYVNAGPEIAVASTKATTAQITVMHLLANAADSKLDEGREELLETASRIEEVIEENEETIEELAEYFSEKNQTYFIGRDRGHEVARESCLKFKEISYTHSEAFPGGEFKHGNLALVEEGTPIVSFLKESGYDQILSNTIEARSRGADIIGVGSEREEAFDYFLEVPEEGNREIYEIVLFQMIAYETSVESGHNPDKPRNLAKSVTVK